MPMLFCVKFVTKLLYVIHVPVVQCVINYICARCMHMLLIDQVLFRCNRLNISHAVHMAK